MSSVTAPVKPGVQDLINWCIQPPASQFVGDAHALYFFLNRDDNLSYQGFLLFQPAPLPASVNRPGHFLGTGRVGLTPQGCEIAKSEILPTWVRITMSLKGTINTSVEFFVVTGSGLVGDPRGNFETDAPISGNRFTLSEGTHTWDLDVNKTTLRL
jgi:hypothetical protein